MLQEVPLITKKSSQKGAEFEVCKEGLGLLRTLRTKKLRIIFNITHQERSLNQFNGWLFGNDQAYQNEKIGENVCLTISKHYRELEDERIILIFNAYQGAQDEPFMVLLGYLASSVFLYHSSQALSENSALTRMLQGLKVLLANTDINKLNREMTFKKGYSKFPHFLCLLPKSCAKKDGDPFKQFYRYREGQNESFYEAVDALIDFLPERSSLCQQMTKEFVNKIGVEFQQNVLGREIFNFEFTGSTMENLCFQCCQIFNSKASLNLSLIYAKIIENQKSRLEDEAYQYYLKQISIAFFHKGKVDFEGHNIFPINTSDFMQKHREISQKVLNQTLKLASYCMSLSQYTKIHDSLQKRFDEMQTQLQNLNHQKIQELCRECFGLLQNIDQCEINSASLNDLFREITNKLQLFISECSQAFGNDHSFKAFTNYLNRLQSTILQKFRSSSVQAFEDYQLKIQEYRVQREDLKYNIRVLQNKLRQLQYEYNLQEDILNQYKLKLIHEPEPVMQQSYSSQLNKFRKRIQQLEEEGQDKNLYIQELEGIIERFQGLTARDRLKYKFSKEIAEMIKEVSNDVTNCHAFIKQAKKTNQLHEEIKEGFAKQRQLIVEERRKGIQEFSHKQAELQKIIKEKRYLQQVINQAKQSIQVYKQVDQNYKESISHLQNTYTQAQCLLAETQNELQLFKKAISLISQQQTKGTKSQSLNKFYKVATNPELKELLKPFLRK